MGATGRRFDGQGLLSKMWPEDSQQTVSSDHAKTESSVLSTDDAKAYERFGVLLISPNRVAVSCLGREHLRAQAAARLITRAGAGLTCVFHIEIGGQPNLLAKCIELNQ
jgi:hypothetical protein